MRELQERLPRMEEGFPLLLQAMLPGKPVQEAQKASADA